MAVEAEITVFRGEEILLTFTHMSPPITGWTIKFTVAKAANSKTKMIPSVTATIVSGGSGIYTVSLDADQTDIQPGTYFYDVARTDAEAERVIAYGSFIITPRALLPL